MTRIDGALLHREARILTNKQLDLALRFPLGSCPLASCNPIRARQRQS